MAKFNGNFLRGIIARLIFKQSRNHQMFMPGYYHTAILCQRASNSRYQFELLRYH